MGRQIEDSLRSNEDQPSVASIAVLQEIAIQQLATICHYRDSKLQLCGSSLGKILLEQDRRIFTELKRSVAKFWVWTFQMLEMSPEAAHTGC